MIGKKINQLATELAPVSTDLTIIGDPTTGVSKKITLAQLGAIFSGAVSFYSNLASFPAVGDINVMYCAKDTKKLYLWSGSAYVEVFPSQALLDTYQLRSEKGVSNGYASLDVNGKVPISQLPSSLMEYLGTWNAATNTPTLANGTGDTGDVYLCNVAGTVNFGAGPITFAVGDWVIYNGSIWERSSGAVGTVTSVGASITGDSITISNSPITTSGTLAFAFAGNSTQYVNGAGNLVTFPGVINEAQNLITEVYNKTGATLTKGTVVYINGGQGNLPTITKALATGDSTSAQTYGIVRNDITNNNNGYVVVAGRISDLDTQAFTEGTQLYLSPTTAGTYTSTKPYAPNHLVYVGIVVRAHPTQGVIEVKIQNGYEMDELHNVAAQSPDNNDILQYKTATSLWTKVAGTTSNIAEGTNLYYTDARSRAAISLTTTGTSGAATYNSTTGVLNVPQYAPDLSGYVPTSRTLTINGTSFDLSANRSYSVGTVTSVGLSSATSGVTIGSTPITTSGTITLAIATASGSQQGLLSSTDWTTFNNKQPQLNGTGFVKASGTTISYDNSTYLTTSSASSLYLPLAGGTLTGALNGTSASFTSSVDATQFSSFNTGTSASNFYGSGQIVAVSSSQSTLYLDATWNTTGNPEAIFLNITNTASGASSKLINLKVDNVSQFNISKTGVATLPNLAGTGTRMVVADASGVLSTQAVGSGAVTGTGTTNYLPKFTGTSTIGNSQVFDNGTSVGVGVSTINVETKLSVGGGALIVSGDTSTNRQVLELTTSGGISYIRASYVGSSSFGDLAFQTGTSVKMLLNTSGNLGLGVTPSAWASPFIGLQIGTKGTALSGRTDVEQANFSSNWVFDNASKYIITGFSTLYQQTSGQHIWFNAPSGTAGNAISFTQAMTLDASGRLGVGITNPLRTISLPSNSYIGFGAGNGTRPDFQIGHNSTEAVLSIRAGFGADDTDVCVTTGGFVGIGTTSPAMSLQIGNGTATGNQYLRLFNSASDIYFGQTGSNLFSAGNGQVLVTDSTYTSNFAIGTLNASANLIFGTSSAERMRITSGGAVQITQTIQTGAPTNGTAQPWKLGNAVSGGVTTNHYIIVEINGTTYTINALNGLP